MNRRAGLSIIVCGLLAGCNQANDAGPAKASPDAGVSTGDGVANGDRAGRDGSSGGHASEADSGGAGDSARDAQVSDGSAPMDASTGHGRDGAVGGARDSGTTIDSAVASTPDAGPCGQPPNAPLEGFWTEVAQITCFGTEMPPPNGPIQELHFALAPLEPDRQFMGQFSVTWWAIETYIDYTGTVTGRGLQNGVLSLQVDSFSAYRPDDVDGDGTFEHCNDELVLRDVWLGTQMGVSPSVIPMCGHRFEKQLR